MDRLNVNSDLGEIENDLREVREQSDALEHAVDELFAERREKEEQMKRAENNLNEERKKNANMVNNLVRTRDRIDVN